MHLTLKKETTKPAGLNFLQQQARFDDFIEIFNNERPHEALDMKCPAEVYQPSMQFPELLTVCEADDLLCEKLIPEFPTQLGSKIFGDLSRARSIFSLDRDDSDHHSSKCLDAVADKVEG